MENYTFLHQLNIFIHVVAGTLALFLGFIALISKKGKRIHKKSGVLFLILLIIVIITGFIGVFVFERNTFLIIITILSAYYGFSGYRILISKTNTPKIIDILIAIIALIAVFYFLYYFKSIGMYWVSYHCL